MKQIKTLIKTLLVGIGFVGGTMSAVAEEEYTDVYYRCSTFGDTNIWTENDLTDWSGAGTLGIDVPTAADDANHYGFGLDGNQTFTAKKEFTIQDGAKVIYDVVWHMGSSTGRANNYSFIQFGDNVRISWNNAYYFYLNLDGQSSTATQIGSKGGNTTYNKKITIIFNTATKRVESFIFDGSDITSNVVDVLAGNFNSVSFGFIRGGSVNWTVPTYLTSIRVSEQKQTVSYKDYTINYKLGDDIVYTKTESAAVGDEIKASTIVYDEDGGKYFIVSDDVPAITISGTGENVLDVPVRKAYTATLNVKTTIDGVSTTESKILIEADDNSCNWSYFYSLYAEKDGKYYVCDNTETFGEKGTFNDGEVIDKEVAYSTLADDVVFFFEAEKGTNTTNSNIGAGDAKYSNGGYAAAKAENKTNRGQSTGVLSAGKYQFIASIVGNANRNLVLRDKSSEDKETNIIASIITQGLQTVEFTLDSEKELVVNGKNTDTDDKSNQSADFDYALIKKVATYIPVEISADGYTTFSSESDVDFSDEDGVTVYTAKLNEDNTVVKLTEVADKKVPAGAGVLLEGEGRFNGVATTGVSEFTDNAFVASVGGQEVTIADGIYVLNNVKGIGFYPFVGTLTAGKAHLVIANSDAKSIKMSFGDETTGINEIEKTSEVNGVYHTLSGIRVQNPTKGLYILNGKKVVIK